MKPTVEHGTDRIGYCDSRKAPENVSAIPAARRPVPGTGESASARIPGCQPRECVGALVERMALMALDPLHVDSVLVRADSSLRLHQPRHSGAPFGGVPGGQHIVSDGPASHHVQRAETVRPRRGKRTHPEPTPSRERRSPTASDVQASQLSRAVERAVDFSSEIPPDQ
jgi:hypothetical protein